MQAGTRRARTRGLRATATSLGSGIGGQPRPWRASLAGALTAGLGLGLVAVLAFRVNRFGRLDAEAFNGFWLLQRPGLVGAEYTVTHSVDPVPFMAISFGLAAVALLRRRPVLVPAMGLILIGANVSTQLLKAALPAHSTVVIGSPIGATGSFPSGHATACMSLVLCAALVAPARARPFVAAAGALYALLVGCAVLILASHYPSDVMAGYLMAAIWAFLSIAALRAVDLRSPERRRGSGGPAWGTITAVAWVLSVAICAIGLAIAVGPDEMPTVPFALAAALIALIAAASVSSVAELSSLLERGPSRSR